ncbi:MAG: nucleotide sugar dehydrogenase [Oscillospiraceae bacterium]|nr:nucleotide sugar dehydrogenase [Oscillospiraceae bacterium]MDD4413868.1 nucleotide sugar dehydrogenase [Oscillospiraceae bacterium]
MKVNIVGMGYIGLPTALSMAAGGINITGTDKNKALLDTLRAGRLTFKEKGMPELFKSAQDSGNLSLSDCCVEADIYIVAVPTPYHKISKKIDASYVAGAVNDIVKVAPKGAIIAVESTIPPGTMERDVLPIIKEKGLVRGVDIHLAHVPERIIPGNMVYELQHNARTIGVDDEAVGEKLISVYRSFNKGTMTITDIKTAEMTKVVENTYRDVNIAFANELARICARDGMDVREVIKIANMHPRVNILSPGPGVGGHCISVDPWFLIGEYPEMTPLISSARKVNDAMPSFVLERVSALMKENGITDLSQVGFYGLTYKENVDDTRESPTLQLIEHLENNLVFNIRSYDPMVTHKVTDGQVMDFDEFLSSSRLVVIMVAHDHIKENEKRLEDKLVYDTRSCLKNIKTYQL